MIAKDYKDGFCIPVLTAVFSSVEDPTMQVILGFILLTLNQLTLGAFQLIVAILDGSIVGILEALLTPR